MIVPLPWRVPPLRANDRRSWPAQHRAFQQALTEARWAVRADVPCDRCYFVPTPDGKCICREVTR